MPLQDVHFWLSEAIGWRWSSLVQCLERVFTPGSGEWVRHVMDQETAKYVGGLDYAGMDALEISGEKWKDFGFGTYRSIGFEEFDVCERPLAIEAFDVVIIEQVLEHVLWPFRAARHLHQMLRGGGVLVVTTPFLVKIHNCPFDCSRWTELGLKHLLAEGGFALEDIQTGSWGNRICAGKSYYRVPFYVPWLHTLQNDPKYPLVIWAFARKPDARRASEARSNGAVQA
ncbi:MAG TPA: methyltransferase domain-containing protein [Gemmataceae bacterium]|nr:methyltransferase domain-containing protein [Gemmataceae bacterium]